MNQPIVIIGIGELGGVFAKAFLHAGYPVYPVTRRMDIARAADTMPDPQLVLVAVAEKDFPSVMQTIPVPWRNCIGLLQNELLPRDWKSYHIEAPTVICVWFEKKKGMDANVLIPSQVHGPQARLVAEALSGIDIAAEVLATADDLLYELVRKNVFVFTINIAGLVLPDGATTAGDLLLQVVHCRVEGGRRRDYSQQHTGQHILSAALLACGDQKEAERSATQVTSEDVKKEAKEAPFLEIPSLTARHY